MDKNTTLENIYKRRSIKFFDQVNITTEMREALLKAAAAAPSSSNLQPYTIVWAQSPGALEDLSKLCFSQSPAVTASALVVIIADMNHWKKTIESYEKWMKQTPNYPPERIKVLQELPYIERNEIMKWAIKSTSLACQNMMIAAESMGLNTCPMEGFDLKELGKYLKLNLLQEIAMIIAIGKKSDKHKDLPQWRRPLTDTVKVI